MAIATIELKDKNFRIVIPEAVRKAENLQVGDIIQIEVKKTGKARIHRMTEDAP